MSRKSVVKDALHLVEEEYRRQDPDWDAKVQQEKLKFEVAMQLYQLRIEAGLTQRQLAERVGTSHSHIARLENAEYEGHSLSMLKRIAAALDSHVEVQLIKNSPASRDQSQMAGGL